MTAAGRSKRRYGARPIKRRSRRTKAAIAAIREGLAEIIELYRPMTVRQVFYLAVVRGLVDKTEQSYKTVCRLLALMRREGEIDYADIADNTRWMRKPTTHSSLAAMLQRSTRTYRRAIWEEQGWYVEIWLEKEALAGVLVDVTDEWDVPLMVTRGYPSLSYLHSAAEAIGDAEKSTAIYYFGDYDPSGVDISCFVESELKERCPHVALAFHRVAVTENQIEGFDLPTRPTKTGDSRSKSFGDISVQLDAIEPDTRRQMCRDCIECHVDQETLKRTQSVEAAERETRAKIVSGLNGGNRKPRKRRG
jgi:hypothetical protein